MSKINYFQMYHSKENVSTANTMLLLDRLYNYSPKIFYQLLAQVSDMVERQEDLTIQFNLQAKGLKSCPDAVISQKSIKIIMETKLYNQFNYIQLKNHIDGFGNEDIKVLFTIDPLPMKEETKRAIEDIILSENQLGKNIIHFNTTFEDLIRDIGLLLKDYDYEMREVLDDFRDYCTKDGLISDLKYKLRMQLAGATINENVKLNLYYDGLDKCPNKYKYLGLYSNKSIRYIGKVYMTLRYDEGTSSEFPFISENGKEITQDIKDRVNEAISCAKKDRGWDISVGHRFFIVEKFFETDFRKESLYPPRGGRVFDLRHYLGDKMKSPLTAQTIAEELNGKTWEDRE